jgi:hypothetical protein
MLAYFKLKQNPLKHIRVGSTVALTLPNFGAKGH